MRRGVLVWILGLSLGATAAGQEADARRARAEGLVARGTQYLEAGDPGSAVGFFVDALRVDPRHELAYLRLVEAHRRRRRHEDAMGALEVGLRMRPRSIPLRLARAELLVELGRSRQALDDLRLASRLDPASAQVWCSLAEVARSVGAYGEALAAYRRLLSMSSTVSICADVARYVNALGDLASETDPLARACAAGGERSAVVNALCNGYGP